MTKPDIGQFFDTFIAWIRADVKREIELAARGQDAGNVLCALGLLVYSEALGRLQRRNDGSEHMVEQPEKNFFAFFDRLGGGRYGEWHRGWRARFPDTSLYEVLRSGMVHEGRPKIGCDFVMGLDADLGIAEKADGLIFNIVPYYAHFCEEADKLRVELEALPHARVPETMLKLANAILTGGSVASSSDPRNWPPDWKEQLFRPKREKS